MYAPGINRLFYTAAGFREGAVVTGVLLTRNLEVLQGGLIFQEGGSGTYFCDVSVSEYGTYFIRVYEDAVLKLAVPWHVDQPVPGEIKLKTQRIQL